MPEVVVPVVWVPQETAYFCGPAVAQMTLAAVGASAPIAGSWQSALWNQIKQETPAVRPRGAGSGTDANPAFPTQKCVKCQGEWMCWTTTPAALERVLNLDQGAAVFKVGAFDQENDATAALMATIDQGIPGIALVFGWVHWLVVDGYTCDEPTNFCMVAGRALNSVYIRDPEQNASLHLIDCDAWRRDYLSFVPCGEFQETIVALSARPIMAPTPAALAPPPLAVPIVERRVDRPPRYPGMHDTTIVPPDWASETAEKAAAQLRTSPRWTAALSGSTQRHPVLVQRLDRDDSYYYITEYVTGHAVTARLIVDATSNRFTEASGIERAGEALPPFVDPAAYANTLAGMSVVLPSLYRRTFRPGTVGEHPVLVWRPCRESSSPFMPFYLLSLGDEFVYVRVDGKRFTRLTDGPV